MNIEVLHKNLLKISAEPTALMALGGLILLILVIIRLRKVNLTTKIMAHIGIMLALATVIKMFRLYHLPQGGSITAGSMVPILLMAIFYGPEIGFLTGFLYGIISFIMSPYVLHPVQVLFDYPLPFIALGLIGYFRQKLLWGALIAIFGRFLCHFISGIVFFASYAPAGMSPYLYSLITNGIFMGLEGAICIVILTLLPIQRLAGFVDKVPLNAKKESNL